MASKSQSSSRNSSCSGWRINGLGYTFPAGYKRNLRGYADEDRRQNERISHKTAPLQAKLTIGDEKYATLLIDLSTYGAVLDSTETPGPNAAVELSIPDIPDMGSVKGILARKDKDRSFFRFLPDQRAIDQIRSYIKAHAVEKCVRV